MRHFTFRAAIMTAAATLLGVQVATAGGNLVVNGDFSSNGAAFVSWPGYVGFEWPPAPRNPAGPPPLNPAGIPK